MSERRALPATEGTPKVLHLSPTLLDREGRITGGGERYVLELARHMAEVVPTRLVTFGAPHPPLETGKLQVRILPGAHHVRGQAGNPLHPAVLSEVLRADVVHCHQTHIVLSSLTALLGRAVGRPVFTTDLGGGGWDVSAYLSTDGWYRGHLHISEYSREIYGHGDLARARVILGGVDTEKFSPPTRPSARSHVLFVGRLLPHKGIDDLIRAAAPDRSLVVVGRVHEDAYFAELQTLAVGKDVRFVHDADDKQLVELYRDARCLVLPSVYRPSGGGETRVPELLGQTLLEAMACGTPAICTEVASMPEIVEEGRTGFIVPPNDPTTLAARLERLWSEPALVEEMGTRARMVVLERFSWSTVVSRCLAAYRELA